jgi:tRNA A-37 threonylcarbamoyl transferase component Bud32
MMQAETRQIVENLMKAKLGEGESLGGSDRSEVWRVPVLDTDTDLPATIVVKQTLEVDYAANGRQRFIRDLSSLQFLNSLFEDNPPVPRLYAFDNEKMIFVMQDIREGTGFHLDLLGENFQQTETRLMNIARTLGKIHAASADKLAEYKKIREALGTLIISGYDWVDNGWSQLTELSGIPLPDDVDTAYTAVKALLDQSSRWSVFTHGDLCPDNVLVTDEKAYILDFESSNFNTAGYDASYPRVMMPTCWCAAEFPKTLIQNFETAYRSEMLKSRPEISDDKVFEGLIADGMAVALSITFNWAVRGAKENWEMDDRGLASWRQRLIYRLNSFHTTTKQANRHRILGDYAAQCAESLSKLWSIAQIPVYPAFS